MSDKKIKLLTIIVAVLGPLLGFGMFGVSESIFEILPMLAVILSFSSVAMFVFFAWQKRKTATRQEKYLSYQAILSSVLISVLLLNVAFFDFFYGALFALLTKTVFMILLGVIVIISWRRYIRQNPDLSKQRFHLIYLLGLLQIMMGCFELFSSLDLYSNIGVILISIIIVVIFAIYAFQNIIFRR